MAAKATDPEHSTSPDMTKCSLPHLNSYVTKTLLGQSLVQTAQTTSSHKLPIRPDRPELRPMSSFVLGLSPPHRCAEYTFATSIWCNFEMSFASPRTSNFSGMKQIHGLDVLNDRTQERLILELYMGNSLRLDCGSSPNTLFPSRSVEASVQLAMHSYKTTRSLHSQVSLCVIEESGGHAHATVAIDRSL